MENPVLKVILANQVHRVNKDLRVSPVKMDTLPSRALITLMENPVHKGLKVIPV
jgi:hypothetical protein